METATTSATDTGAPAPAPATAPATAATTPPKKARRAEHEWINAAGDVVDDIESATGCRYTDKATNESASFQIPAATAGSVATMFAAFGLRTKMTNDASGARQARVRDPKVTMTDVAAILASLAAIKDGQFGAPAEGAKAPKYDLDALADSIVEMLTAQGRTPNRDAIRTKLGTDVAFRNGALQTPDVLIAYTRRTGKGSSIDQLDVQATPPAATPPATTPAT